ALAGRSRKVLSATARTVADARARDTRASVHARAISKTTDAISETMRAISETARASKTRRGSNAETTIKRSASTVGEVSPTASSIAAKTTIGTGATIAAR